MRRRRVTSVVTFYAWTMLVESVRLRLLLVTPLRRSSRPSVRCSPGSSWASVSRPGSPRTRWTAASTSTREREPSSES